MNSIFHRYRIRLPLFRVPCEFGKHTKLSGPLQEAVNKGDIEIRYIPD